MKQAPVSAKRAIVETGTRITRSSTESITRAPAAKPLTLHYAEPILALTSPTPHSPVESDDLKQLESRIDQLIEACQRLRNENDVLKSEQGNLQAERAKLLEKTRIARERIEAMIGRLKALERG